MIAAVAAPPDLVAQGIEAIAAERVEALSGVGLGEQLISIRGYIDRLEGEFLRRLAPFDRAGAAVADGSLDTVSWLRRNCRVTGATALQRVTMARSLAGLPRTSESLCSGRASFTNTSLIAKLADAVGEDKVRSVEESLVEAAARMDPGAMRDLAMVTRVRLDPDGALGQENRNHERRWVSFHATFNGMVGLRGELDAEGGAILQTAVEGLSGIAGSDDDRTAAQRRADALVDLAARRLKGGDTTVHGQRPHLSLIASIGALRGEADAEPATLHGVGPVNLETARRIACDSVRRVVAVEASPSSAVGVPAAELKPLSVGREMRTVPAHIRTALSVRDRGCRFPGCDRPPEWADGHHIDHWAFLAPTELANLVLLCRRHHRFVHEKGWQVRMANGTPVITPPP